MENIDLERRHAWIHADEAKTKKAIPVPLNDHAIEVLISRRRYTSSVCFYL